MSIIFKGVRIRRNFEGKLVGELEVSGDFGKADLNLTEELCAKILDICADNIVEAAEVLANDFRRESMQLSSKVVDQIGSS